MIAGTRVGGVRRALTGALLALSAIALAACGGGDTGGTGDTGGGTDGPVADVSVPDEKVTVQQSIELDAFAAIDNADLQAISSEFVFESAGMLEDTGGRTLYWAEGTDFAGARGSVLQYCDGATCTAARQRIDDSGVVSWTDAGGASLTVQTVGQPILLKNLTTLELDSQTEVATGGLSTMPLATLDPNALPSYDYGTRRFIALNTFGDLFGTTLEAVTDAVAAHGGYDEIEEWQYAREEDVHEVFEQLHHNDAVVWLTQGVRQQVKDEWREARTVGLTVNRGGFGDATMDRNAIEDAVAFNVAAGPGVVFLAASNSYSDGTEGQPDSGSIWQKLQDPDRIVVGIEGEADVARIIASAAAFFDSFFGGEATLAEALVAGTAALQGTGASLQVNQLEVDQDRMWLRTYNTVFEQLGFIPSSAQIRIPIVATPNCGPPGGPKTLGLEDHTQPFADITFDGAAFSGHREYSGAGLEVAVDIIGVVSGLTPGNRVLIEVWGDVDEQYRGFHAFGEGIIQDVLTDDETGVVEVKFDGRAFATTYTNDLGEECSLKDPRLQTTASEKATIVLTP